MCAVISCERGDYAAAQRFLLQTIPPLLSYGSYSILVLALGASLPVLAHLQQFDVAAQALGALDALPQAVRGWTDHWKLMSHVRQQLEHQLEYSTHHAQGQALSLTAALENVLAAISD